MPHRYSGATRPATSRWSPRGTTPTPATAVPARFLGVLGGDAFGGQRHEHQYTRSHEFIQVGYSRRWHTIRDPPRRHAGWALRSSSGSCDPSRGSPGRPRRSASASAAAAPPNWSPACGSHDCSMRHPHQRRAGAGRRRCSGLHADGPLVLAADLRAADWRLALAGIDGVPQLVAQAGCAGEDLDVVLSRWRLRSAQSTGGKRSGSGR